MAAVHGALPSEPHALPTDTPPGEKKRKREDEATAPTQSADRESARGAQTQKDVLDILHPLDPTPSFLDHNLGNRGSDERSPKKAKLSDAAASTSTISSKLASGAYADLSRLRADAEHVRESLIASIRGKARDGEGQDEKRVTVDELKQIQRIRTFEQVVKDVVEQECRYEATHGAAKVKVKQEPEDSAPLSGRLPHPTMETKNTHATILTLFGNAPTPKQLFSSMQHPAPGQHNHVMSTELPVEEMSLPNGLAATKILPLPADGGKKGPTFDESFAPAYNLPELIPPKSVKRSSGRDTSITWEFTDRLSRRKSGGFTAQSLPVGKWLSYGGQESNGDPASPGEKRKQRDRALSGGESSQPPPRGDSLEEATAKEEEALFRRAYSSFAPSCDDSRAMIPAETKNAIWWDKIGRRRYAETFAIDPALLDDEQAIVSDALPGTMDEEARDEDFSRVVEEMEELDVTLPDPVPVRDKTNVDQVLQEISQLLETLASYQRIRNATLASSTSAVRTPISPAPTLASRIGRPDSPAEDELATYRSLRRELTYLILKLPPYAVAKLDGDQLAELGVSKLITFDGKDTKGTMEEDQVARLAKYNAMATAAGLGLLTRPGSNSGQHYSSTSQRTPAIGQAANTRYGQTPQYGATRPPAQPQFHRSTSNQSMYGTPSATAPRPGYGQQPNQYTRPQQSYNQPNGQQYYRPQQTPGSYGAYNQQQYTQPTPQSQQRPAYSSSQPLAQFQQRAQSAAQNSVAYQTNSQQQGQSPYDRTASPIKPAPYSQPIQPQRPLQPGSGRATPSNYPSQPQTPVNGYPPQRPPPPPVAPRDASGTPQPPLQQQQPQQTAAPQPNGHARRRESSATSGGHDSESASTGTPRISTCEFCDKGFTRHSSYVVHLRSHTGERPFVCEVQGCRKDFAVRSNLNRHLRATHQVNVGSGVDEEGGGGGGEEEEV